MIHKPWLLVWVWWRGFGGCLGVWCFSLLRDEKHHTPKQSPKPLHHTHTSNQGLWIKDSPYSTAAPLYCTVRVVLVVYTHLVWCFPIGGWMDGMVWWCVCVGGAENRWFFWLLLSQERGQRMKKQRFSAPPPTYHYPIPSIHTIIGKHYTGCV